MLIGGMSHPIVTQNSATLDLKRLQVGNNINTNGKPITLLQTHMSNLKEFTCTLVHEALRSMFLSHV
jgi:hypothetical protein